MTNQRVRAEWYHEEVGRGYMVQVWDAEDCSNMGSIKQYDVELAYGGRMITKLSHNCYGEKSAQYWCKYHIKMIKRIMMLLDDYDMACNNVLAYSKSYAMNEPRDGYEEKWKEENEKSDMIYEWICELMKYSGDEKYAELKSEFSI